ncbi:MAG: dihydroneopterin aldolase [Burkholderiaceae bacterium]|nr:MAG: dihydroneopterin aldolase [Burkholderiaceae bacterium]
MPTALTHPQLLHCRRIFLRNYVVAANIGIHDCEKNGAQRILINVDLFVPLSLCTPTHDNIHEVLDYDFMRSTIDQRIAQGHINLQETLCDDIARILLAHEHVFAVRVSTEKPDIYPDSEAVGVEVFHVKAGAPA